MLPYFMHKLLSNHRVLHYPSYPNEGPLIRGDDPQEHVFHPIHHFIGESAQTYGAEVVEIFSLLTLGQKND